MCFNKIAGLCCTNWNSTITRIHQRLFSEYVTKIYILGSTAEVSLLGFRKIGLYKISENFLRDIFNILYLTKLQTSDLYVSTLLKKIVLQKHIEITFNSKGDYYYLKKIFIFECRCRHANDKIPKGRF